MNAPILMVSYQDVRWRHLVGESLNAIRRATGLAPATVRKYAGAESFPERAVRGPRHSILDPFLPHLARRLVKGCADAMALWRELQGMGYAHGPKMVQRWMAKNRIKPAPRTARKWLDGLPAGTASGATADIPPTSGPALPSSPKQLAWLLVQPVEALSPADAVAIRWVERDSEATLVVSLARRFTALVRRCGTGQLTRPAAPGAELDAWLAEAKACGIGAVETFAGLKADGAAIRAALTET